MGIELRDYSHADGEALNRIAVAAFRQYSHQYQDWETFVGRIAMMESLAESAELIVATRNGEVAGTVAYVAPGQPKASFFEPEWPVLRMLVVDPAFRGQGIGRALTTECVRRAERDGASLIALHTSPIMEVALAMYSRMGFELSHAVPPIHGVPYGVYIKRFGDAALGACGASL